MTRVILFAALTVFLRPALAAGQAMGTPLTLGQILDLHKNAVPCRPLAARIAERGINFEVTSEIVSQLKAEQVCDQAIGEVQRRGAELARLKKEEEERNKLRQERERLEKERQIIAEEKKRAEETAKLRQLRTPTPEQVRLVNLGVEMIRQQRYQEALEQSERALKLNAGYEKAWNLQGDALRELKRFAEAVTCYEKSLAINPVDAFVWSKKALALADLSRHEEAVRSFDHALDISPMTASIWAFRGNSLLAIKQCNDAKISYDKAVEIDPSYNLRLSEKYNQLKNCGS